MREPTPSLILSLKSNQIFVFGSNTEGRHGKGAARVAMKFGARYGEATGPQGRTYAIVTKELSKGCRSVPLELIAEQVTEFLEYARSEPELEFLVSPIGCGLAGYRPEEIAPMFAERPENVRLPKSFIEVLRRQRGAGFVL